LYHLSKILGIFFTLPEGRSSSSDFDPSLFLCYHDSCFENNHFPRLAAVSVTRHLFRIAGRGPAWSKARLAPADHGSARSKVIFIAIGERQLMKPNLEIIAS
jgi:hypothetical protein